MAGITTGAGVIAEASMTAMRVGVIVGASMAAMTVGSIARAIAGAMETIDAELIDLQQALSRYLVCVCAPVFPGAPRGLIASGWNRSPRATPRRMICAMRWSRRVDATFQPLDDAVPSGLSEQTGVGLSRADVAYPKALIFKWNV
jgi:hypothetical protein